MRRLGREGTRLSPARPGMRRACTPSKTSIPSQTRRSPLDRRCRPPRSARRTPGRTCRPRTACRSRRTGRIPGCIRRAGVGKGSAACRSPPACPPAHTRSSELARIRALARAVHPETPRNVSWRGRSRAHPCPPAPPSNESRGGKPAPPCSRRPPARARGRRERACASRCRPSPGPCTGWVERSQADRRSRHRRQGRNRRVPHRSCRRGMQSTRPRPSGPTLSRTGQTGTSDTGCPRWPPRTSCRSPRRTASTPHRSRPRPSRPSPPSRARRPSSPPAARRRPAYRPRMPPLLDGR